MRSLRIFQKQLSFGNGGELSRKGIHVAFKGLSVFHVKHDGLELSKNVNNCRNFRYSVKKVLD